MKTTNNKLFKTSKNLFKKQKKKETTIKQNIKQNFFDNNLILIRYFLFFTV